MASAQRPPGPRWLSRAFRRPAVLAAALLIAVLAGTGLVRGWPGSSPAPPPVDRARLAAVGLSSAGIHDTAGLDDPARRAACLRAANPPGVSPDAGLAGGRRVTYEGQPGVLLVLTNGRRGAFDIVVVDPACGQRGGTLLSAVRVGA